MDSYLSDLEQAQLFRLARFECYFGAFILSDAAFRPTNLKRLSYLFFYARFFTRVLQSTS